MRLYIIRFLTFLPQYIHLSPSVQVILEDCQIHYEVEVFARKLSVNIFFQSKTHLMTLDNKAQIILVYLQFVYFTMFTAFAPRTQKPKYDVNILFSLPLESQNIIQHLNYRSSMRKKTNCHHFHTGH